MHLKKCLALVSALIISSLVVAQDYLNVMTFNIRYNNPGDSADAWPHRTDMVASQILFHQAHIVGMQEALHGQITDVAPKLPQYKFLGVGRDGGEKGEYSAIFYDTTRLQLLEGQTFWLSQTPTVVASVGWDAALTRVVTWAKFKDRKTKKIFYHFNTHFDHRGPNARRESASLLINQVQKIAGKTVSITTGDFNARPSDEPIKVIVDKENPLRLTDSKEVSVLPHYGPTGTFNAFKSKETEQVPIDFIFIKNGGRVLQHATLSQSWGGHFSSDHFPVFARIIL